MRPGCPPRISHATVVCRRTCRADSVPGRNSNWDYNTLMSPVCSAEPRTLHGQGEGTPCSGFGDHCSFRLYYESGSSPPRSGRNSVVDSAKTICCCPLSKDNLARWYVGRSVIRHRRVAGEGSGTPGVKHQAAHRRPTARCSTTMGASRSVSETSCMTQKLKSVSPVQTGLALHPPPPLISILQLLYPILLSRAQTQQLLRACNPLEKRTFSTGFGAWSAPNTVVHRGDIHTFSCCPPGGPETRTSSDRRPLHTSRPARQGVYL